MESRSPISQALAESRKLLEPPKLRIQIAEGKHASCDIKYVVVDKLPIVRCESPDHWSNKRRLSPLKHSPSLEELAAMAAARMEEDKVPSVTSSEDEEPTIPIDDSLLPQQISPAAGLEVMPVVDAVEIVHNMVTSFLRTQEPLMSMCRHPDRLEKRNEVFLSVVKNNWAQKAKWRKL